MLNGRTTVWRILKLINRGEKVSCQEDWKPRLRRENFTNFRSGTPARRQMPLFENYAHWMPTFAIIVKIFASFFLLIRHSVACKLNTFKDCDIVDEHLSFGLNSIAKDNIIVHQCSTHKGKKCLKLKMHAFKKQGFQILTYFFIIIVVWTCFFKKNTNCQIHI